MNAFPGQTTNQQIIGDHARVTYRQVRESGDPQDPAAEFIDPTIFRGQRDHNVQVIPATGDAARDELIYLMRSSINGGLPDQGYRIVTKKQTIPLSREGGWGHILFAIVLPRVGGDLLFQEPTPGEEQKVVIKKLNKRRVHSYLERGGNENPYREIQRMQQIGNNIHVIKCVEALEDDKYLYIIMPLCEGRTLYDNIIIPDQRNDSSNEIQGAAIFLELLQNLHYLQENGICHHDLSPDNMAFYRGRLVFLDFAMSIKVPLQLSGKSRLLIKPQGNFGKAPWMAPEILVNRNPFDGYTLDLWAAATILYVALMSCQLFNMPDPSDILFKYFVIARGLSNQPMNERTIEMLQKLNKDSGGANGPIQIREIVNRIEAQRRLSFDAIDLLQNMLKVNPAERFTLAEAMESRWIINQ